MYREFSLERAPWNSTHVNTSIRAHKCDNSYVCTNAIHVHNHADTQVHITSTHTYTITPTRVHNHADSHTQERGLTPVLYNHADSRVGCTTTPTNEHNHADSHIHIHADLNPSDLFYTIYMFIVRTTFLRIHNKYILTFYLLTTCYVIKI